MSGQIFRVAQGHLGVYESAIPQGCESGNEAWTPDEIAERMDEVLTPPEPRSFQR